MQKRPVIPAAPDVDFQLPANDRKRKRRGSASDSSQKTISELFSASETKPHVEKNGKILNGEITPNRKRRKHPSSSPMKSSPQPLSNMYSFSSQQQNGDVIDLTSCPVSPPRRPPKVMNYSAAPKKLVVKNLRTVPRTDPAKFFEQQWEKLSKALDTIFGGGEILPYSYEELYQSVQNVCKQGRAEELEGRFRDRATKAITEKASELSSFSATETSYIQTLEKAEEAWENWNKQFITVRQLFMFMDRSYLLANGKPTLDKLQVTLFHELVFQDPKLQPQVLDGAIQCMQVLPYGANESLDLLRKSIALFHSLGVYHGTFEPRLLAKLQEDCVKWSETAYQKSSVPIYVKTAKDYMDKAMEIGEAVGLDASTRRSIMTMMEHALIDRRKVWLLDVGAISRMLDGNAVEDLGNLYQFLKRLDLQPDLREPFAMWIDDTGTEIVFDEKDYDNMVVGLLALKMQLDNIWEVSFERDHRLGHRLREAFDVFMNKSKKSSATWNTDNSKPGEMIAKYVDMLLRGGSKAIPQALIKGVSKPSTAAEEEDNDEEDLNEERQVDKQLDQVLDLFRFVHGKAVFEAFYKKDLARRLLMNRSASQDAERSMLDRLKTECGAQFTANLEQMFKDVELSREEVNNYKMYMAGREASSPIDLSVSILSAAAWPTYPDIPVNIPVDVKNEIDSFEKHYKSKHSGRKLSWKHALAHCQLRANFPRGRKEIVVSSFQAIVLLLFNGVAQDEQISYQQLLAETGLPPVELKRTLQSLACAKLRPLRKHPVGREVADTDTFSLNANFSHEKYRIKINQVQLKETKEENKETHERVSQDRQFETQAAIVRIMKSKKKIGHNLLIAEVIEQTKKRGVLSVADIKKNIDKLIDKEYMEREDGNMYSYVA